MIAADPQSLGLTIGAGVMAALYGGWKILQTLRRKKPLDFLDPEPATQSLPSMGTDIAIRELIFSLREDRVARQEEVRAQRAINNDFLEELRAIGKEMRSTNGRVENVAGKLDNSTERFLGLHVNISSALGDIFKRLPHPGFPWDKLLIGR